MRKIAIITTLVATIMTMALVFSVFAKNHKQTRKQNKAQFMLTTKELMTDTTGKVEVYPTYATQIINLANRNAQATRPSKVGQMSELIQKFDGKSYREWEQWYTNRYPEAIDHASEQTWAMLEKMRKTMNSINKPMVRRWISELILAKTYIGLKFQKSILKKIASIKGTTYRLSNPKEEPKGIDGYIGATAVSIKPVTYKNQPLIQDTIRVPIIYYEKVRGGINVYYNLQKQTPAF